MMSGGPEDSRSRKDRFRRKKRAWIFRLREAFEIRFRWLRKAFWLFLTSPYRLFKALCFSVGFLVVMSGLTSTTYLYSLVYDLPEIESMRYLDLKQRAQIHLKGRYERKRKKIKWMPIKKMSRDYLYSIVLSEDAGFFEHEGIEFEALIKAALLNFKQGKYKVGASTISQQVAKNLFLTQRKTLARKFREMVLARELEERFTKNEILEIYLNIAEFGPDLFGAKEAARYYFKKRPQRVNAAEGAFIALMLPSPRKNHYSVFQNKNLTRRRKRKMRKVLRNMYRLEYISAKQYQRYYHYPYFPQRVIASQPEEKKE